MATFEKPKESFRRGNIEEHVFDLNDRNHSIFVSKAESPIASIHFVSGFKTDVNNYYRIARRFADIGIESILCPLRDPGYDIDFDAEYNELAKAVYVKGKLDQFTTPNIPIFAGNHSTGGFLFTKLLSQENSAAIIAQRYKGFFMEAPFYGSWFHRHPLVAPAAKAISRRNANELVGNTGIEISLMKRFNEELHEKLAEFKANVTHEQALYFEHITSAFLNSIKETEFPTTIKNMPSLMVLGNNDDYGWNKLSEEIATRINTPIIPVNAGHRVLFKSDEGLREVINFTLETLSGRYENPTPSSTKTFAESTTDKLSRLFHSMSFPSLGIPPKKLPTLNPTANDTNQSSLPSMAQDHKLKDGPQ